MMHSEKPAGMTVAEALGIRVAPDAPGGQPIHAANAEGAQRTTRHHSAAAEREYAGFGDLDAWSRPGEVW